MEALYNPSRVDFVKPDVLASGRLLTNMTSQVIFEFMSLSLQSMLERHVDLQISLTME